MNLDKNSNIYLAALVLLTIYIICTIYFMGGTSSQTMSIPTVNSTAKHTATVIFLHGLGDQGHGWLAGFEQIRQPHIKYMCPNAKPQKVSLNFGMVMPSWFDIKGLEPGAEQDEAGIKAASQELQGLINLEVNSGIDRKRIIIGGFSQGGAVSLYSALAEEKAALGGVLGLSTWLPLHKHFPAIVKANQDTPILQCHGSADPLVQLSFGEMTANLLKSINKNHRFKVYQGMQHSSCPQEMEDVKKFIDEVLPPV